VTTAIFLVAIVRKMPEVSYLEGWIWIVFSWRPDRPFCSGTP